jgi:ATP-dependent Lhr-like helicase
MFHPAVSAWFNKAFSQPTEPQRLAWPSIQRGENVLIAAPTGSGKTLAAFLAAINDLVEQGLRAPLPDQSFVVYVSPLKALSNDIKRNLETPLAGIRNELLMQGMPDVDVRTLVRTGDTPQSERTQMRKKPPHIAVTTPESLYILLTSESGRKMLSAARTVIVDEIHALARDKRGSHLALSLERLDALAGTPLTRIGLSATQRPIEKIARFLVNDRKCAIIDAGHIRARDLAIEVPPVPLEAVMSGEVWQQVYNRVAELIAEHRTTLVFVNTRRMAERVARHLSERIGEENIAAHHGSLAKEQRLNAEQRLKNGELKALVATASLELGIDIGEVDLVCQLGSTRSISAFLQRVGRSGHAVTGTPKGRLFPSSRDELVECSALLDCVRRGELDAIDIPTNALDVLAQQIIAECASRDYDEDELFALVRRAYPYRDLSRQAFDSVVEMLASGVSTRRGRRSAHLHRDQVNHKLRGRRGARLAAMTSGGTIPDTADYTVILEPDAHSIGTVNEDFAVESLAGDIFQLGNASYRILKVESGRVRVEDAHGLPPSIPFWLGEAPPRSDELSLAVSRLREEVAERGEAAVSWLVNEVKLGEAAATQIAEYLLGAEAALGTLPTHDTIVFERFFDESGGTQLVVHSPYGSRVNRAWGLALRKRFCRKFNFELQAAADEDAIVLSLTSAHSFPLEEPARYLHSNSVRQVATQAVLDAPMFNTRFRWNSVNSLALQRSQGGTRVPAQLQRMRAEDLMCAVFPDLVACAENLVGERQIPDHPLVNQTLHDCLHVAMDIEGLEKLLRRIETGEVRIVARDLTEPSPLAQEILNSKPYTYLDDAPLEERRTRAVMNRRYLDPESAADIGRLDPLAIERVREEAWPDARHPDELHDALQWLGYLTDDELQDEWRSYADALANERRATRIAPSRLGGEGRGEGLWIAAERVSEFRALFPHLDLDTAAFATAKSPTREEALKEIVRSRLTGVGPVTGETLAIDLALPLAETEAALITLETEGAIMRGWFTPSATTEVERGPGVREGDGAEVEWCERGLLARINRYTIKKLRAEIEPVAARDFMRFLFVWQHVDPGSRMEGPDALSALISQLEGFEAPAAAWETELFPARLREYEPAWLDDLCLSGKITWRRLDAPNRERTAGPVRTTPIALLSRRNVKLWSMLAPPGGAAALSSRAQMVADELAARGASFFDELMDATGLLQTQLEDALGELVAAGRVTCDSFAGLRALLVPSERRPSPRRRRIALTLNDAGRWALLPTAWIASKIDRDSIEHAAHTLLKRYGVVFFRLLDREPDFLPPWRDLLSVYRRWEARGDVRGGRFVAGIPGEQFALPEAIGLLREIRRKQNDSSLVSLSAADPLNLVGSVVAGPRVPALTGNRILYRDGIPAAVMTAGEVQFLEKLDSREEWEIKNALIKKTARPARVH